MTKTPTTTTTATGTTIDESALWRRDSSLPFQTMDDEIIVVDPATRQVHLLNATAAHIWTLLQSAHSLPALVTALEQEFDAGPGELRAEVVSFLGEMTEKHLCAALTPPPPLGEHAGR
jgi:hypothetical protein